MMIKMNERYMRLVILLVLGLFFIALLPSAVLAQSEGDEPADEGDTIDFYCESTPFQHPVASALAERYDVDYEEVLAWFCEDGLGLGEIGLALYTVRVVENMADDDVSADAGVATVPMTADDLLAMRLEEEMGWGQIWQELGFIGRPKADDVPVGLALGRRNSTIDEDTDEAERIDNPGPPESSGRPEDVGRPDGVGRPSDAGRPDGAGKPEGGGRPDGANRPEGGRGRP
jgi:hypothetical protein